MMQQRDAADSDAAAAAGGHEDGASLEKDRLLPIANVARLMKRALPENAKIAKDTKDCMQECVSEFISFVTSEAADRCALEKRKTVNGDDILWALQSLGFDNYSETLKTYLAKYREANKGSSTTREDPASSIAMQGTVGATSLNASTLHAFEQQLIQQPGDEEEEGGGDFE